VNAPTFDQFLSEILGLYSNGNYTAALRIVTAQGDLFPEQRAIVYNLHFCLLAISGDQESAIQVLQSAIDQGYWWPVAVLRGDTDLAALQGHPDFERLVTTCAERHTAAQMTARAERLVIPPAPHSAVPYPMLVAFHPRNSSAQTFARHWADLSGHGWLVVLPQSSQVCGVNAYCWDDRSLAENEAREHFAAISAGYAIDPERIVLAGFSQGGGLAAWLSASQLIPAKGFVVIGPYLRSVDELLERPAPPAAHVRGYLITGDLDRDGGIFDKLETLLTRSGISYRRERRPTLGHDMPADFEMHRANALKFIFKEE